jgi:superfamily II DNA or RNA helicase
MADIKMFDEQALSIGAGAVFKYSDALWERCQRKSTYGDAYSLGIILGEGANRRLLVPRNLARHWGEDLRTEGASVTFVSGFIPRNTEQERVISEAVSLLKAGKSFLMEAPTGFGKTWCAADIIAQVGKKTLIVVTKQDILHQWVAAFGAILGLTMQNGIGVIQADTCVTAGKKVVIAMVQSLSKDGRYPPHVFQDFGLVVYDECHRIGADHFALSGFRIPAKLRLGISATPDRKDGKGEVFRAHIGPVLVSTNATPMTPRVIARRSPWEIPYVRRRQRDGTFGMVQMPHQGGKDAHVIRLLSKHFGRNRMIAEFVVAAYKKGRTILVQSDLLDHLDLLGELLTSHGVPPGDMGFYVGGRSQAELNMVKGTKRVILSTYKMTSEATDIPAADTLVMCTPRGDIRQIAGRILRWLPDKKEPVIFDIFDDTSSVYNGYWGARKKWYASIGAKVDLIVAS